MWCFIHIENIPCYARDKDGITVEVYGIRVGDADPIYMDRIGRTYNCSLCFDSIKELEKFYSNRFYHQMKG